MAHEYAFKRTLNEGKLKALAKTWHWSGEIEIDGSTLRSERPIPERLYQMLERIVGVETSSLDLYQACRTVYNRVLEEGETAFPSVYDLLEKYGFSANCVLSEMIDLDETSQHLGKKTAGEFLNLAMGMEIQPRLFC